MRFTLLFILIAISTQWSLGQSSDKKSRKKEKEKHETSQPTSKDPFGSHMDYSPKKSKVKFKGTTYNSERNYYERMEDVRKTRKKEARELMKPQYSDPLYFGHKNPPKKHKAGKIRYCKECGIRH
jgi:hypothetical protein